jgi:serine/threonine protein phosphatase PrpC
MKPEIDSAIDSGSTTSRKTNEDYLWVGLRDGINAVLILDGTSGVAGDFGAKNEKTGGRRYVEKFGAAVKQILEIKPQENLEEVMKSAIENVWDEFEEEAEENTEKYFNGEDVTLQRASTVPAAVGAIIRWNDEKLELLHVGDVETYIKLEDRGENFSNETHESFDKIRDEYIREYGKESSEVQEILRKHRSGHNLPGTYPNMSFNPLAVDKLGEKSEYPIEEVEKVLLSTDGAAPRFRELFKLESNEQVVEYIEKHGAQKSLKKLREKENKAELNALKSSDDAAIALLNF